MVHRHIMDWILTQHHGQNYSPTQGNPSVALSKPGSNVDVVLKRFHMDYSYNSSCFLYEMSGTFREGFNTIRPISLTLLLLLSSSSSSSAAAAAATAWSVLLTFLLYSSPCVFFTVMIYLTFTLAKFLKEVVFVWDLRSSGMMRSANRYFVTDFSKKRVRPIFKVGNLVILEEGIDTLSRNVGNKLPPEVS